FTSRICSATILARAAAYGSGLGACGGGGGGEAGAGSGSPRHAINSASSASLIYHARRGRLAPPVSASPRPSLVWLHLGFAAPHAEPHLEEGLLVDRAVRLLGDVVQLLVHVADGHHEMTAD